MRARTSRRLFYAIQQPVSQAAGSGPLPYYQKVLNIQPANLVAFWRMNETEGATAADLSGHNYTADYLNSPTLANAPGPDGVPIPLFNGTNQSLDIAGASTGILHASPNLGKEGSMMVWAKVLNVGIWTDSSNDMLFTIGYNGSWDLHIKKYNSPSPPGGAISYRILEPDGQHGSDLMEHLTTTEWFFTGMTWSETDDIIKYYYYDPGIGHKNGTSYTGLTPTWGAPDWRASYVGAYQSGLSTWNGWLALPALWNTPLSAEQMTALATI